MTTQKTNTDFYGLGIAPGILETLTRLKFTAPTPIQSKAIPIAIEGKDIIGVAQTGTGKTLAFCIPMYQRLAQSSGNGLILVPTRELALQVQTVFHQFGHLFKMSTTVIIGGAPFNPQVSALRRNPRIIIATPGRLIDHIQRKNISLSRVCLVVLDEADRMLDMGFAPQINRVLGSVGKNRQTMLFSATLPSKIMELANKYMKMPINVEIAPSGTVADNIDQKLFIVNKHSKFLLLKKMLKEYPGSILLFIRTRYNAHKISKKLIENGYCSIDIHSNRTLKQRKEAMDGFRSGRYRILVATDIASRGIDVKGIEAVINYDVPDDPEDYVHRIGRTARIGNAGHAITFATRDQKKNVMGIEKLMNALLPVSSHPEIPSEEFSKPVNVFISKRKNRPFRPRKRRKTTKKR